VAKAMLINVTHAEESRVAIVDNGVLDTFEIETLNRESIKGNVYNGLVEGINTTLNAAFVRYGADRAGFLPMDEVNFRSVPLLKGRDEGGHRHQIRDRLERGQRLLVQVIKDGFSTKPASLTTYYSLPGRYLVLMPGSDSSGISRKIEDAEQRDRLKKIVEELSPPEGYGIIVRTAGFDVSKIELHRDLKYLLKLWENILRTAEGSPAPSLVYQERDLVIRTIRDYFTHDITEIFIDSKEMFDKAQMFFQEVMPSRKKILKLYTEDRPIFTRYNLEEQIESIYKRRVPLKSGGEIVIDGTEALTAIDVNSAKSRRESNIEDMATATNLEAAEEIARQLRIRDIGGLIVIDFIDMRSQKNIREVERALKEAMRRDKAKYDVTRISKLGLLEISRQRLKSQKAAGSYISCPVCGGHGLVRTTESAALAVLRKIHARVPRGDLSAVKVQLPPEVAIYLLNNKREDLAGLERRYKTRISVVPNDQLRPHQSEIELIGKEGEAAKLEEPQAPRHPREARESRPDSPGRGQRMGPPPRIEAIEVREAPTGEGTPPAPSVVGSGTPIPGVEGGEAKRRRRRRRRRRSRHGRPPVLEAGSGESRPAEEAPAEPAPWTVSSPPAAAPSEETEAVAPPPVLPATPGTEEEKPLKKIRRLWWRKRSARAKASTPGSEGSPGDESSDGS
jgi:ribonuclease E